MMFRRWVLKTAAAVVTIGLAGCLNGRVPGTDTPTEDTPTPTRGTQLTGQNGSNPIEYLVRSDDDETHRLEVTIETPQGTIVHRKTDAEFTPDEQLGGTFSPSDASEGPYPVTVSLDSLSITIEWKPQECVRFDLLVAVTADGQLEVEREACIK